jgi:hypothetical protein
MQIFVKFHIFCETFLTLLYGLLMMIWKVKQPSSLVFTPIQFPNQKSPTVHSKEGMQHQFDND